MKKNNDAIFVVDDLGFIDVPWGGDVLALLGGDLNELRLFVVEF